jgi:hypothetical protein
MTKRKLFTVSTRHLNPQSVSDALDALHTVLRQEFPAYWFASIEKADTHAAVIIATQERGADFQKLDGWGHSGLTLAEVK